MMIWKLLHSRWCTLILTTAVILLMLLSFVCIEKAYAEEEPLKNVTVVVDPEDKSGNETKTLTFFRNDPDGAYSEWIFVAAPAEGYYLKHIYNPDTGDIIESINGLSVTIREYNDNAEYYAVFDKTTIEPLQFTCMSSGNIFEKQKVTYKVGYKLNGYVPAGTPIIFYIYDGEEGSEKLLTRYTFYKKDWNEQYMDLHKGEYTVEMIIPSAASSCKYFTVVSQFGSNGEKRSKTFDASQVKPSKEYELEYLNIPGEVTTSDIGGYNSTLDNGPGVLDAASFVEPYTGKLHTYFATTSGIVYSDGSEKYEQIKLSKNPTNVMAIGGENEDDIYALELGVTSTAHAEGVRIYQKTAEGFKYVEGSYYENYRNNIVQNGTILWDNSISGLIMSGSEIWLDTIHWDGTTWSDNDIWFNSFYKANKDEAYAGSSSGIYKYSDGTWNKVKRSSGECYILNGIRTDTGVRLLCSDKANLNSRVKFGMTSNITTSLQDISVRLGVVTGSENIDISSFDDNICGASFDCNGNILLYKNGLRTRTMTSVYTSSEIFIQDDGEWIYYHADEFDAPIDLEILRKGEYSSRIRPDGVRYGINTIPGVTYFFGEAGAVYVKYGDATILFDSKGGSSVPEITQKIGSTVKQPMSPVKNGYLFGGWYTDLGDSESLFTFDVMPVQDTILYAKWLTEGSAEYDEYIRSMRERSLANLDDVYGKLHEDHYDPDDWVIITNIYLNGKKAIQEARYENDIYQALNDAIEGILSIKPIVEDEASVCLTMELFTINEGYIIKPTIINTKQYEQISVILTEQLKKEFPEISQPWKMTGSVKGNFYLSSVYSNQIGWIGEFDKGRESGWMYAVNNLFPSVGAASKTVDDGDVIRWQYTVSGYGADLGTSEEWAGANVKKVANKDALTWLVAEVNEKIDADPEYLSKYGLTDKYEEAMTALTTMYSSQEEVDAAENALQGLFGEALRIERNKMLKASINEEISTAALISNEDGKYTASSFRALQEALTSAREILSKEDADNETLYDVLMALKIAKAGLVEDDQGTDGSGSDGQDGSTDGGNSSYDGNESGDGSGGGQNNNDGGSGDGQNENDDGSQQDNTDGNSSDNTDGKSSDNASEKDNSNSGKVKAVVINSKKVTAAVVKKALKKANNTNATVVTLGKKVKTIKKGAFKKTKIKTLIVKTKKLKKASVKGCLKSSRVKTVKVKVGNKKANKSFVKKYKKIFTKKNAGRKVRVK